MSTSIETPWVLPLAMPVTRVLEVPARLAISAWVSRPCLNDLGQREGKLGAKFHFGRIGLRQPQGTPKLVSGPNRHGLSGLHDDSMS